MNQHCDEIGGVCNTLLARDNKDPKCIMVIGSTQANAYVGDGRICSTLTKAMGKGGG